MIQNLISSVLATSASKIMEPSSCGCISWLSCRIFSFNITGNVWRKPYLYIIRLSLEDTEARSMIRQTYHRFLRWMISSLEWKISQI